VRRKPRPSTDLQEGFNPGQRPIRSSKTRRYTVSTIFGRGPCNRVFGSAQHPRRSAGRPKKSPGPRALQPFLFPSMDPVGLSRKTHLPAVPCVFTLPAAAISPQSRHAQSLLSLPRTFVNPLQPTSHQRGPPCENAPDLPRSPAQVTARSNVFGGSNENNHPPARQQEPTQEEFFHTFHKTNLPNQAGKQIVSLLEPTVRRRTYRTLPRICLVCAILLFFFRSFPFPLLPSHGRSGRPFLRY